MLKTILKLWVGYFGTVSGPMADSHKFGSKPSHPRNGGKYIDWLRGHDVMETASILGEYLHQNFGIMVTCYSSLKVESEAIPVLGRGDSYDCETTRIPHYLIIIIIIIIIIILIIIKII
jgi:hypothetical protein